MSNFFELFHVVFQLIQLFCCIVVNAFVLFQIIIKLLLICLLILRVSLAPAELRVRVLVFDLIGLLV